MKKLYRSNSKKIIAGVCGGIAEYLNVDPTVVRLICALLCLGGGSGIILYIIAAVLMPEDTDAEEIIPSDTTAWTDEDKQCDF